MHRRDILKSAGCLVMLPALESFGQEAKGDDAVKANRLFCMNIGNGMCSDNFPTSTGKDYQSSSTFQPLEKLKNDFTLCTNLRNYGDHESTMYAFAEYSDHRNPQLIKDSVDEIAAIVVEESPLEVEPLPDDGQATSNRPIRTSNVLEIEI